MAEPLRIDLKAYVGLGFVDEFQFQDENGDGVDFTGYAAKLHVRKDVSDVDPTFSLASDELPTATITFPGNGVVHFEKTLPSDTTAGQYSYDFVLQPPGGKPTVWTYGHFTAAIPVTRWS